MHGLTKSQSDCSRGGERVLAWMSSCDDEGVSGTSVLDVTVYLVRGVAHFASIFFDTSTGDPRAVVGNLFLPVMNWRK